MIDVEATMFQFGHDPRKGTSACRKNVVVVCHVCQGRSVHRLDNYKVGSTLQTKLNQPYYCTKEGCLGKHTAMNFKKGIQHREINMHKCHCGADIHGYEPRCAECQKKWDYYHTYRHVA